MDTRNFPEATFTRLERYVQDKLPRRWTYVPHGGRSCVQFDGAGHLQAFVNVDDVDKPVVLLHEMAHVYHCWAMPLLSASATETRAEACAISAEVHAALEGENPLLVRAVGHRLMVKHSPAATRIAIEAIRHPGYENGRDVMAAILEGKHG